MMITAPDLRDPGLCRNTLSFAEHRRRLATHGWSPLSRDQARAAYATHLPAALIRRVEDATAEILGHPDATSPVAPDRHNR